VPFHQEVFFEKSKPKIWLFKSAILAVC